MNDMPPSTGQLERELSRSLHERVDRLSDAPISLRDVQGRARGITRRRRLVTGVGIAAAAALLVPTALLVAPGSDDATPQPVNPSPTQVTPDEARAGGQGLDISELPMGEAPAVSYLDRTGDLPTIVHPDGRRIEVDVPGEVHGFAVMADSGYAVVTSGDGGDQLLLLDPAGRILDSYARSGGVVVPETRSQVVWAAPDGTVRLSTFGPEPTTLGSLPPGSSVVSMTGQCLFNMAPAQSGGCVVTAQVQQEDGTSVGWVLSSTGVDGPVHAGDGSAEDPAISTVADFGTVGRLSNEDYGELVAGVTEVRDDTSTCSGVYGPTEERVTDWLVETCAHRFGTFSPDTSRIIAWESQGSGIGHNQIGMYDVASGELLWYRAASEPGMAFVWSATWEDDGHLLAPAYQDGLWSLVRFGPDGAMELAAQPVAGEDTEPAYVPEIQP